MHISIILSLFILQLITAVNSFGINLIKVAEDDHSQVVCTMALLRKYFNSGDPLSGSVLYMSLTTASSHTQKSLLAAINEMKNHPWTIVTRDPKSLQSITSNMAELNEKPQCYFVVIENLEDEDLEDIFEDWKKTYNWNPLAQFVVYLASVEETDEEMTELMIEILLSFMNKKIYNVNVIGQNEENGYFYGKTVFPYHPDNNCGNRVISIETLDVCDYQDEDKHTGDDDDEEQDDEYSQGSSNEYENDEGNESKNRDQSKEVEEGNESDENNKSFNDDENTEDDEGNESKNNERSKEENGSNENDKSLNANDGKSEDVGSNESKNSDQTKNESENNENDQSLNANDNKIMDDEPDEDSMNQSNEKSIETAIDENTAVEDMNGSVEHTFEDNYEAYKGQQKGKGLKMKNRNNKAEIVKAQQKRNLKMRRLRKKRAANVSNEKFDYEIIGSAAQSEPNLYIEEIYRALFYDKFPKDLSGCPLLAAFRPWEPYIFTEAKAKGLEEEELDDFDANDDVKYDNNKNNEYDDTEKNQFDNNNNNVELEEEETYTEDSNVETVYDSISSEGEIPGENGIKNALSGIEYQLLLTIGERLHINIDLQVENRNLYHLFQQLIDGDIEMIIGGIDEDPSISQFVSTTIPYHQDDLTWCVAKARRSYNLFNFLASFSPIAWLLTFMFACFSSATIFLMQKVLKLRLQNLHGYAGILFRVIGIIFSQSMPLVKMPTPIRMTFATMFFMGLIFLNAYQSFLISTLTTPKSAYQISSVEEIYQHRMKIMGSVENVRHLSKPGKVFKYIREKFEMCYNIEECLLQAAENENIAVAVSRQHAYYNPRIPRNQLYCFDRNENLYVYLVTMLLPKKFHLLHMINPVIQHVIESGHMQKWARDLDMRRRILEERNHVYVEAFRSLTLDQVFGCFVFTGVFLAFACLVLILECWVNWLATRRRPRRTRLKIIKYLHRKFQQN